MPSERTGIREPQHEPGAPVESGTIALSVPEFSGNEWLYLKECLDSTFVSSVGPFVTRFEEQMARIVGTRHAVATVNGTAALHVALLIAGVEPDDEILTSTLTFIAPANAIRYANARPIFIDAEPQYWQMDPEKLRQFVENRCERRDGTLRNRATGRRIRAILPVHILGHPVDLDPILDVARRFDLRVIEDATESLGASYKDRKVGALGDVACLSFNGNKLMTTGGGGMIVTNDAKFAERARYLTTQAKDDSLESIHGAVGFNYRLSNLQAAVGCAQAEQLDAFLASKRRIAGSYEQAFESIPGITSMPCAPFAQSAYWLYTILIDPTQFRTNSRELMHHLQRRTIQSRPLWQPMHRSKPHGAAEATDCTVAERLNRDALSIPCSVGLTVDDQQRVIDAVLEWATAMRA